MMGDTDVDFAGRRGVPLSVDWCTPPKYVSAIVDMLGEIHLDPCSNSHSIVPAKIRYSLPFIDGLKQSWDYPTIFCNPPYGADRRMGTTIKHWVQKCSDASKDHRSEVLALIPVATNTRHWKDSIFGHAQGVCFLYDTRLKFLIEGSTENKGAPMACCIVYWGKHIQKFYCIFEKFGAVVALT